MRFNTIDTLKISKYDPQGGYKIDDTFELTNATPGFVVGLLRYIPIIGRIALGILGYIEISGRDVANYRGEEPQKVIFVKKSSFRDQLLAANLPAYQRQILRFGVDKLIRRAINDWMAAQVEKEKEADFKPVKNFYLDSLRPHLDAEMSKFRMKPVEEVIGEKYKPKKDFEVGIISSEPLPDSKDLTKLITADKFGANENCFWCEMTTEDNVVAIKDQAGEISFLYENRLLGGSWKLRRPGVEDDGLLSDPKVQEYIKTALGISVK